jgi:hypothetical protein
MQALQRPQCGLQLRRELRPISRTLQHIQLLLGGEEDVAPQPHLQSAVAEGSEVDTFRRTELHRESVDSATTQVFEGLSTKLCNSTHVAGTAIAISMPPVVSTPARKSPEGQTPPQRTGCAAFCKAELCRY